MAMFLESVDQSQRFPLDRDSIFVGRSERKSDICLDDSSIADVHCELLPHAKGIRVVAMTDSGVTVNGKTVHEAALVTGDELGIAEYRFRLLSDTNHELSASGTTDSNVEQVPQVPVDPQNSRWFVRMSGMNLGPIDWNEVQAMIGRGEVRLDDDIQREDGSTWQSVRDVLPKSGGDALLGDEPLSGPGDEIPERPRSRKRSRRDRTAHHESPTASDEVSEDLQPAAATPIEMPQPLAPQFYIMRDSVEIGPLPRQAVQELADDGSLQADSLVRLEDSDDWSTARAVGFRCASAIPSAEAAFEPATLVGNARTGGIMWMLFAPFYYTAGLARSVASVDPRRLAIGAAIVLALGIVIFGWFRSWSQTAMRGVVTLDGEPVNAALVQLTGALTGDSALGVTSSDGSFRVVTLDGKLKPGLYLVTVRPLPEVEGRIQRNSSAGDATDSGLPRRYRHLNTTDATIEITADQSQYTIELTEQQPTGTASVGFQGGDISTSHAHP